LFSTSSLQEGWFCLKIVVKIFGIVIWVVYLWCMENLKMYGCFLLALMSAFMLGVYSATVKFSAEEIEIHQWFLTSMFGLFFFLSAINILKSSNK